MTHHQQGTTTTRRYLALAVLATTQLMVVLDGLVMLIALPSIQEDLNLAPEDSQWVITSYALALGSLLLLGGRVSDDWGRKRAFIAGVAGFTVASALGGLAQNDLMLFGARALQGVTAALLVPAALSLISVTFTEPRERARAFAVYSAVSGSGVGAGMLAGGLLTEYANWRWCLLVNLPIGLVVCLAAIPVLTESRLSGGTRYDIPGTLTVSAGLGALVYGFARAASDGWSDPITVASLVASVVLVTAFAVIETKVAQPLLPLRLMDRTRTGAVLGVMLQFAALIPLFVFLIYFLQGVEGFSPMKCGLALLPYAIAGVVCAAVMEQRIGRMPPKIPAALGLVIAVGASIWFSFLDESWGYWTHFFPVLVILGAGVLLTFAATATLSQENTPDEDAGVVSALYNAFFQIGCALGPAVLTTVQVEFTERAAGDGPPSVHDIIEGYQAGIIGAAVIFVIGAIMWVIVMPNRKPAPVPAVEVPVAPGPARVSAELGFTGLVSTAAGAPVPGAWLTLISQGGGEVDRMDTAGDGRFRVAPPEPGHYLLVCTTADFPPSVSMVSTNGHSVRHDIVLRHETGDDGHRVQGVVRSAGSGSAIAEAAVALTGTAGRVGETRTGADGAFGFDDVPAGVYELRTIAQRQTTTTVQIPPKGPVDPIL